jgi:hypothetical protein
MHSRMQPRSKWWFQRTRENKGGGANDNSGHVLVDHFEASNSHRSLPTSDSNPLIPGNLESDICQKLKGICVKSSEPCLLMRFKGLLWTSESCLLFFWGSVGSSVPVVRVTLILFLIQARKA